LLLGLVYRDKSYTSVLVAGKFLHLSVQTLLL